MLHDDELDRMVRGSDPFGDRAPAGLADPDGPTALRVLTQTRRHLRRRRTRRLVLIPAVAVVLAGATAATQAWIAGDGEGHALDSVAVICNHPTEPWDFGVDFDIRSDTPVEACRRDWREMFGEPAPASLVACVDSGRQGQIEVYRGGPEECAHNRSDPYAGPTSEQLRFAHFREDLAARFAGETCVSHGDLRAAVTELLAARDLTGWTTDTYQNAEGPLPAGSCAAISFYDERNRTVVLGPHPAGDEMWWP